jgi:uncharacterized membrane protein SirB2
MMTYSDLRVLHILFASISLIGFIVRGLWMLVDSPRLSQKWVRRAPHINDTLLLGAAIRLAVISGQFPWTHDWLAAKIAGLLVYIGLGVIALRPGRPRPVRLAAWLAALICFAWIVSIARLKDPRGFIALI